MNFKSFDKYSWVVTILFVGSLISFFVISGSRLFINLNVPALGVGNYFYSDSISYYLIFLSVCLGISLLLLLEGVSNLGRFMILLSIVSSVLSYCCLQAVGFWVFYEMSILPLLLLLILESPYSERYIASWYLLGYVVLTSLPMLLCIFYVSLISGSFFISSWNACEMGGVTVFLLLSIMFITKIPLPPFHVWLPIVHAEASSSVSVCLSGYVMKLGILGVCRFCSWLLPSFVFSSYYVLLGLCLAVLFFFSASRELDGKRWLAFLSLSHIVVAATCLCVSGFDLSSVSFFYCLGHGLSAGVIFILLWGLYEVTGSRNWGILKYSLSGSLAIRFLCGASLCTAASLPPTTQFFSEVFIVSQAQSVGISMVLGLFVYLFLGGLVPVFLLGSLLTRHYNISFGVSHILNFFFSVSFLVLWCFGLFLIG